jgi:uncharacterized membrane protein YhaH (DUF805 family)
MSEPTSAGSKPGWYPDPETGQGVRYWDGSSWSTYRRDAAPPTATSLVGKSRANDAPKEELDRPDGVPYVTLARAVSLAFKQYSVFRGRATRSEYWWWVVFGILVDLAVLAATRLLLASQPSGSGVFALPWLELVVGLALLLPQLAVATRRLHDMGFSGAWLFLLVPAVIPIRFIALFGFICAIVLLVLLAMPSQPTDNRYGPPSRKGKPTKHVPKPDLI